MRPFNPKHTMSFWKKLFGDKESPKADIAERESAQPSVASNPQPPSIRPMPATPPQPTIPLAHPVAARDQSASFHDAVMSGDLGRVKALLKDNADLVFSRDTKIGGTPLYWAAVNGHKEVADLLLANKAAVNAKDNLGWTPLRCAAVMGQKDVAELLLASKAEVNAKDLTGATPYHKAAALKHEDVVELLRQHGGHD